MMVFSSTDARSFIHQTTQKKDFFFHARERPIKSSLSKKEFSREKEQKKKGNSLLKTSQRM